MLENTSLSSQTESSSNSVSPQEAFSEFNSLLDFTKPPMNYPIRNLLFQTQAKSTFDLSSTKLLLMPPHPHQRPHSVKFSGVVVHHNSPLSFLKSKWEGKVRKTKRTREISGTESGDSQVLKRLFPITWERS